jgi:hypothetical protein
MTVDEMERVLDTLGVEYVESRGDEIQGFCPAHFGRTGKQDNNPSWYINSDTGAFICFSCQFKGSLPYLISYVNDFRLDSGLFDLDAAKSWLNTGGELSIAFERAIAKPKETFEELVFISEASLAAFISPPEHALKSRGLTTEASDKHQLLWDRRQENWIIPQRDCSTSSLMGWQEKGYSSRYFKNYPSGVKKSNSLFGYQAYSGGDMIVVESPLDVVRLDSVGVTGGVAIYGSAVSDVQLDFILKADRIIFALDSDEAGLMASFKLLEKTKTMGFEAWFFDYSHTDMKDVGGMSKAEILQGLLSAKHSVRYATWGDF